MLSSSPSPQCFHVVGDILVYRRALLHLASSMSRAAQSPMSPACSRRHAVAIASCRKCPSETQSFDTLHLLAAALRARLRSLRGLPAIACLVGAWLRPDRRRRLAPMGVLRRAPEAVRLAWRGVTIVTAMCPSRRRRLRAGAVPTCGENLVRAVGLWKRSRERFACESPERESFEHRPGHRRSRLGCLRACVVLAAVLARALILGVGSRSGQAGPDRLATRGPAPSWRRGKAIAVTLLAVSACFPVEFPGTRSGGHVGDEGEALTGQWQVCMALI